MKLQLKADKVMIRGPKVDGSYVLAFEFGEYEVKNLAQLLAELDTQAVVDLTIEQNNHG